MDCALGVRSKVVLWPSASSTCTQYTYTQLHLQVHEHDCTRTKNWKPYFETVLLPILSDFSASMVTGFQEPFLSASHRPLTSEFYKGFSIQVFWDRGQGSLGRQAKVGLDQLLEPVNSAGERESSMPSHSLLPVQVQCSCSLCLI